MAEDITNTTARLDIMNDGLQTTAQLNDKILASANRTYSSFDDTADMVAKLGILASEAFSSNDEIIAFAEQLNKHFAISGTELHGGSSSNPPINTSHGKFVEYLFSNCRVFRQCVEPSDVFSEKIILQSPSNLLNRTITMLKQALRMP
ncbi:tape measure protein [Lysinibacillus sp. NPDC097195]|uniref:tape measure protein n=1 Tax=Lysinibacillus sp. NPDC097195 TaxID=3364141 RepID=UPI0038155B47